MDFGVYGQEEETNILNYNLAVRVLLPWLVGGMVWLKEKDITGGTLAATIEEDGKYRAYCGHASRSPHPCRKRDLTSDSDQRSKGIGIR